MTPYQKHINNWKNCNACELSICRKKVVFARGSIPARVVIIGEAPGNVENVLGKPFSGPAGNLLDKLIAESGLGSVSICITNLVGCIPETKERGMFYNPEEPHIVACAGKLRELVALCKPKAIVCAGRIPTKWVQHSLKCKSTAYLWADITHPSAILRADITMQGMLWQEAKVTLSELLEDL